MNRIKLAIFASILLPLWLVGETAAADEPCVKAAEKLLSACGLDVREERKKTAANCLNISNRQARRACFVAARKIVPEERKFCFDQFEARVDVCHLLGEERYDPDPLLDQAINFIDVDEIGDDINPNPYFNLTVGHTYVLKAGADFEETVIVHVSDETVEVQGQKCRLVVDAVVEAETDENGLVDYKAAEFTDDLYAQDSTGNVYYCGEISRNFENGILDNLDGSFLAGKGFAKGGVLIKAFPEVGDVHRQEFALDEAEDLVQYVNLSAVPGVEEGGEVDGFPCAPNGCLKTFEFAPLSPESTEFKYYIPGTGFVLAVGLEDGEREELVCVGDSLDILSTPQCGIENPQELLEDLCDLASQLCPGES